MMKKIALSGGALVEKQSLAIKAGNNNAQQKNKETELTDIKE